MFEEATINVTTQRGEKRCGRVYIWPRGENVLDNLMNRFDRPYEAYRELLPRIFEAAGVDVNAKARWSQTAGCSCGCSPGFIIEEGGSNYTDLHVDLTMPPSDNDWADAAAKLSR